MSEAFMKYRIVVCGNTECVFIGKFRRDIETSNWYYYEKTDGKLIHFRKEHMILVEEI